MGTRAGMDGHLSHAPPLPPPPPMGDRDVIEAHALHRRRVVAALLWGGDRTPREAYDIALQSLLAGVGLALLIAVVVGVVALVDASRRHQPHAGRTGSAAAQAAPM